MRAEIAPICPEDVLRLFGHADGIEYFVDRIGAGADIVAVLLDHHRRLDDAVAFVGVFLRRTRIVGKLKESFGRKPASGDFLFHFVDERLDAEGHRNVQLLFARDHAVCLGDGRPLDLVGHAERVEKRPHVAAVVGGTEVVELVQRRLELETTSAEAGRKSAGQIVLFDDKHFRAALKQPDRRHETAVAGAYDYCIIFVHMFLLIIVCTFIILHDPFDVNTRIFHRSAYNDIYIFNKHRHENSLVAPLSLFPSRPCKSVKSSSAKIFERKNSLSLPPSNSVKSLSAYIF